jgi:CHAD domain-containing protein
VPSNAEENDGLIQYFDDLTEELGTRIPEALAGEVEAIHDARVATRRLSALVNLFEPQLSKGLRNRFRTGLKQIRRTFGPVRDLDVMIECVGGLPAPHAAAASFLLENLQHTRADAVDRIGKLDTAKLLGKLGSWWGLREQLKDPAAKPLLSQSLAIRLDQFCRYADLHANTESALANGEAHAEMNPHELRIAGKALRYTVEMAIADGADISPVVVRSFKAMQDLLGTWHDLAILSQTILSVCVDEQLALSNAALLRDCLKLARLTARRSEARLEAFRKLWRKEGAMLHQQIRSAVVVNADLELGENSAAAEPSAADGVPGS